MPDSYQAFISYSHRDEKHARWLHRSLESYRVSRHLVGKETHQGKVPESLVPVFRDRDELASSPDLSERINSALAGSKNLVVICSPSAATSKWVNREIEEFKKLGRSSRVFALIVKGDPSCEGGEDDPFPPALRCHYDEAGKVTGKQAEPIAADLRPGADGKVLARQKIISGLLGVGLDELRRRELQRRQRRLVALSAVSLVIAAITLMLAVSAMLARDEAEKRRQQAEELLGYMVGDLRTSLTPIGRLDLLEGVADRAMRYFGTIDVESLTDEELLRQAQVLTQIGEIGIEQHKYDEALVSFMDAYHRSAELQRQDSSDGERLFNRGQAEFWVGYVYWRSGSLQEARAWLEQYRDTSESLGALDPNRIDWANEVIYAHSNLAVLAEESGDYAKAFTGFSQVLEMQEALARRDDNATARGDRADTLSWLGNSALEQGRMREALSYYEKSSDLYRENVTKAPQDAYHRENLGFSLYHLAHALALMGQLERAGRFAQESAVIFAGLVTHDPGNTVWLRRSAAPRLLLARLSGASLDWLGSRAQANEVINDLESILEAGATDLAINFYIAQAYQVAANANLSLGDEHGALNSLDEALVLMAVLEAADRLNDGHRALQASLLLKKADVHRAGGDHDTSSTAALRAQAILEEQVTRTSSPQSLDPWIRVLLATGEVAKAKELSSALRQGGYIPLEPFIFPQL